MQIAEYRQVKEAAVRAEGRIGGALRGGHIHNGEFLALGAAGQVFSGPVETIADLRIYPDYIQREGRPDWKAPEPVSDADELAA